MFTASKAALTGALALSGDIVERRNTLPILSNVLIERGASGLVARMTDLDVEAAVAFEAVADLDFEPFTVPAHLLRDIVRKLADGTVTMEIIDALSPVRLCADGDHAENLIVIMPMRV